jgi:hypothetical protein
MARRGDGNTGLPLLTIFDRADKPARRLLQRAGQLIELRPDAGRNLWAARLDEAVRLTERPVVLVAHGVSCFAVAWWARLSPSTYVEKVAGAVFLNPLGAIATPEQRFDGPRIRMAFPSLIADASAEAAALASDWGSRLVNAPVLRPIAELVASLRDDAAPSREAPVLAWPLAR